MWSRFIESSRAATTPCMSECQLRHFDYPKLPFRSATPSHSALGGARPLRPVPANEAAFESGPLAGEALSATMGGKRPLRNVAKRSKRP
jgi:hypothetical protein